MAANEREEREQEKGKSGRRRFTQMDQNSGVWKEYPEGIEIIELSEFFGV
jgi:hypothetical protein